MATTVERVKALIPAGEKPPTILADIARGVFLGDFAGELGLPGAVAQVAASYLPVVGVACDLRDAAASRRRGDRSGIALNLLALVPIVGGVAKAAGVWRHAQTLRRGFVVSYGRRDGAGA